MNLDHEGGQNNERPFTMTKMNGPEGKTAVVQKNSSPETLAATVRPIQTCPREAAKLEEGQQAQARLP